jgi:hypothetical protein
MSIFFHPRREKGDGLLQAENGAKRRLDRAHLAVGKMPDDATEAFGRDRGLSARPGVKVRSDDPGDAHNPRHR